MKVQVWVENTLIEGEIKKKNLKDLYSVLEDIRRYAVPDREPDFIDNRVNFYVTEGMAFEHYESWNGRIHTTAYELFYNKGRNHLGIREITKKASKKITRYLKDEKLSKQYLNAIADNVLLLGMDEPDNLGKVPKRI